MDTSQTIDIRLRAFQNIIELLNVATQLGVGPKLNDFAAKHENNLLATAIEPDALPSPTQPLGALRKLKTKSVAVQTSISNRVNRIKLIHIRTYYLFSSILII